MQTATHGVSRRLADWIMMVLAAGLGAASLAAFAAFLFAGPVGIVELGLGLPGDMAINAGLSLLFFLQHSGMVRQSFKRWLTRFLSQRYVGASYSIVSGITLLAVVLAWHESDQVIAEATGALWWMARAVFLLAAVGVLWGALALREFDSFGLTPIRPPESMLVRFPLQSARNA